MVPAKKGAAIETVILNAFLRHPTWGKTLAGLSSSDFAEYRDERLNDIRPKSLLRWLSPLENMFKVAGMNGARPTGKYTAENSTFERPVCGDRSKHGAATHCSGASGASARGVHPSGSKTEHALAFNPVRPRDRGRVP